MEGLRTKSIAWWCHVSSHQILWIRPPQLSEMWPTRKQAILLRGLLSLPVENSQTRILRFPGPCKLEVKYPTNWRKLLLKARRSDNIVTVRRKEEGHYMKGTKNSKSIVLWGLPSLVRAWSSRRVTRLPLYPSLLAEKCKAQRWAFKWSGVFVLVLGGAASVLRKMCIWQNPSLLSPNASWQVTVSEPGPRATAAAGLSPHGHVCAGAPGLWGDLLLDIRLVSLPFSFSLSSRRPPPSPTRPTIIRPLESSLLD